MTQPVITLTAGGPALELDPDLRWADEFTWFAVEQSVVRSLTGALLVDLGTRVGGRPITLAPADDSSAWMPRATLAQLQAWEADPSLTMTLSLRGVNRPVIFRRHDGAPIDARPVHFVADPLPGEIGDWYLVTLRFLEI